MADPGQAFPEGDPRNALYFQNLATLQHQYQTTLAGDKESLQNARTRALYQQGLLGKQEPLQLEQGRNRANSEGLLHSGTLAGRTGTLQSQYAQKRNQITSGLQETEGRIARADQGAKERLESGESGAGIRALTEGQRYLEEHPVEGVKPPSPSTPGSSLPKIVGERAQPLSGTRRAAAKRYLTPRSYQGRGM